MVVGFIPLRPESHLDSKTSVGKSPRLGTHQGWFVDYHRRLGEVEKKPLKLYWRVSQLFLKYLTEAKIPTLLLEYYRSREGVGTTLQDLGQPVGLRLPEAHKESHGIHTSPIESNH